MLEILSINFLTNTITNVAFGLEIFAVIIILIAIIASLASFLHHLSKHDTMQECIDAFKQTVGKGIQIALEILIAADLINTVVLSATLENVAVLAILVLIRTFLSWTLIFETEGRWPWNPKEKKNKGKKK